MIDAHAGGIGTVGVLNGAVNNMAYVFGTSSCTMTTTQEAVFVPGVWGPYYRRWCRVLAERRRAERGRRGHRPAAELPSGRG
jgi:ribulose kinase